MTTPAVEREAAVSIFGPELLPARLRILQGSRTPGPQGQASPTVPLSVGRAGPKLDGLEMEKLCQDIEMLETGR